METKRRSRSKMSPSTHTVVKSAIVIIAVVSAWTNCPSLTCHSILVELHLAGDRQRARQLPHSDGSHPDTRELFRPQHDRVVTGVRRPYRNLISQSRRVRRGARAAASRERERRRKQRDAPDE